MYVIAFFCKLQKMANRLKIRPELIGAYVFSKKHGRNELIEEGKEKFYKRIGLDIFEKNAANKKKSNERDNNNSDGVNND